MLLKFGQPAGAVIQAAYVVEDIERSMQDFTARLNIGPWFLTDTYVPQAGLYRGQPTDSVLSIAIGFSGQMSFELIQQHDESPSIFREIVDLRGYGFHHWAIAVNDIDREIDRYRSEGYKEAFSDLSPRGARVSFIDTSRDLPGMVELIQIGPVWETRYTDMYRASVDWNGDDPVRRA